MMDLGPGSSRFVLVLFGPSITLAVFTTLGVYLRYKQLILPT